MRLEEAFIDINNWYETPLGKRFSADVGAELMTMTKHIHGICSIQFGLNYQSNWLQNCPITRNYIISFQSGSSIGDVCAEMSSIPIASASVDCVLLPHVLAYTTDPQQLLQEVNRILVAEGHIIFIGINRLSLWGLGSYVTRQRGLPPWNGKFMSLYSLRKHLHALGYQITNQTSFLYRPPIENISLFNRLQFMETIGQTLWPIPGGAYITIAKKRVYTMTRIKPILRYRNLVVGKI